MTACAKGRPGRRRLATVALTCVVVASSVAALSSCSTDSGDTEGATTFSPRPTPPDTSAFSGTPPSAMASAAESALESARAAASSASAAASSFEASVSAELTRANEAAAAQLKNVEGKGNATSDVSLTGRPRAETGGLQAVVVNIANSTDEQASYAVQVDFVDADGKAVETRIVGAEDLEPGERARPLAISRKPADLALTAKIAKAQRY
ncbi:FxLYD domain-containing protein [Streptomyces sp. NPDC051907]|uniref:FxLYD domain-containing protein n=1 Tax=Streptomyces sp. NPDC051907 TaxID=3155284 RepID=UPI00344886A4